ncbi:hypothetical protein ES708_33030 [subsurface metagenome]
MLLYYHRITANPQDGNQQGVFGVVGNAHQLAEDTSHIGDNIEIVFLLSRRIGGNTVQKYAFFAGNQQGILNISQGGYPGGEY